MEQRKRRQKGGALKRDIPRDLIEEILSRLPVKSLFRFRCVCKSWKDLVRDPNFIKRHLNRSVQKDPKLLILTYHRFFSVEFEARSCRPITTGLRFRFDLQLQNLRPAGTCNGLIYFSSVASPHLTCICNPCTADYRVLPGDYDYDYNSDLIEEPDPPCTADYRVLPDDPDLLREPNLDCTWGFGYSPSSDEYKAVRLITQVTDETVSEAIVHTLGTDSWRSIERSPYKFVPESPGVYLNGTIHWFAYCSRGTRYVACFDVREEKFRGMRLPDFKENVYSNSMIVIGGLLSFGYCSSGTYLNMWVMQEYGDERSWTRRIYGRLPNIRRDGSSIQALSIRTNGEIVILFGFKQIDLYDPRKKKLRTAPICFKPYITNACTYVESLLSPRVFGNSLGQ